MLVLCCGSKSVFWRKWWRNVPFCKFHVLFQYLIWIFMDLFWCFVVICNFCSFLFHLRLFILLLLFVAAVVQPPLRATSGTEIIWCSVIITEASCYHGNKAALCEHTSIYLKTITSHRSPPSAMTSERQKKKTGADSVERFEICHRSFTVAENQTSAPVFSGKAFDETSRHLCDNTFFMLYRRRRLSVATRPTCIREDLVQVSAGAFSQHSASSWKTLGLSCSRPGIDHAPDSLLSSHSIIHNLFSWYSFVGRAEYADWRIVLFLNSAQC